MPGESILFIDDSQAVQDIAQSALYEAGYNVTTSSNGTAGITCPSLSGIDLVILDSEIDGLASRDTMRIFKQHAETHPIPILLMIDEDFEIPEEGVTLGGAATFLRKPFDPAALVRKVEQVLEQQRLDELARQYVADAADRLMNQLADQQITQAAERKTQLIIERCIQNVTQAVDQRTRSQVEEHVTSLVSEKEQELVKMTVREVAQSMVEKLAVSKVDEAMQTILQEQTERAVRSAADKNLPNLIREKTKDMLANIVPREVETRLQRAAEKMVPDISQEIVGTVESVANRTVPRSARELLPQIVETQVAQAIDRAVPRKVSELVGRELDQQLRAKLEPTIRETGARIRRSVVLVNIGLGVLVLGGMAAMYYIAFFMK